MRTLCIDIGASGIKAIVLDAAGKPETERSRMETPDPATPDACLAVVQELARIQGSFDRISVGFPGVITDGIVKTAPNLDPSWAGFPVRYEIEKRAGKPVRIANDAVVQGLSVIEGRGVEMVLTFGTGLGCGLYIDGRFVPNLELAHHPYGRKNQTYEQRVSNGARKRIGNKRWNKRIRELIQQIEPIFNYRLLYLGGGNARHIDRDNLPENVRVVDNIAGLLGGIKLWS